MFETHGRFDGSDLRKTTKLSIDRGNRKQYWSLSHRKIYFKCFFARACLSIYFVAHRVFIHWHKSEKKRIEGARNRIHGAHTAHTHSGTVVCVAQWRRRLFQLSRAFIFERALCRTQAATRRPRKRKMTKPFKRNGKQRRFVVARSSMRRAFLFNKIK